MDSLKSVPRPTLDRPFGVELWPIFDKAYSSVMGYSANKFVFVPGQTPLSTFAACATMLTTYYVTVFAGREFMKKREPFRLNGIFMVHNLLLTTISAILLALFIEQLLPTIWRNGIFYAICDHRGGWTTPLVTLYYVCTPARSRVQETDQRVLAELPDQISRTSGHRLYGPQEETPQYGPMLPFTDFY